MDARKPWTPPDGGYGWVIVVTCVALNMLAIVNLGTFGVLYVEFLDAFHLSKTAGSFFNMCQFIAFSIAGIVVGPLLHRWGGRPVAAVVSCIASLGYLSSYFIRDYRVLYFTYGIMPGIAWGSFYMVSGMVTQQYFDKKRGIAAGIVASGIGLGTIVWPLLTRVCVQNFGWRGTMLVFSAIMLHGLPCAALLRPIPTNKKVKNQEQITQKKTFTQYLRAAYDFSVFKDKTILVLCIAMFVYQLGHLVPFTFIVARAVYADMGKTDATYLLAVLGFCTTFSRPLLGMLGDHRKINRVAFLSFCFIVAGLFSALSYLLKTYVQFMAYAVLYGIICGGFTTLQFPVTVDLIGVKKAPYVTGVQILLLGIGSMISAPFVGSIADLTDLNLPFLILGLIQIIGGLMVFGIFIIQRRRRPPKPPKPIMPKIIITEYSDNETEEQNDLTDQHV